VNTKGTSALNKPILMRATLSSWMLLLKSKDNRALQPSAIHSKADWPSPSRGSNAVPPYADKLDMFNDVNEDILLRKPARHNVLKVFLPSDFAFIFLLLLMMIVVGRVPQWARLRWDNMLYPLHGRSNIIRYCVHINVVCVITYRGDQINQTIISKVSGTVG